MKTRTFQTVAALVALIAIPPALISNGSEPETRAEAAPRALVHIATSANTSSNCTTINSTLTNGKPDAILQVTQNWAPNRVYNDSPIGVRYRSGKWCVCNQDLSPVPEWAAFNVKVLNPGRKVFIHNVRANTDPVSYTVIDHRATNRKSGVLLQVTPAFVARGRYDSHPIGVYYDSSLYRAWEIFHQDSASFARGAAYNVEVLRPGASNFIHTATADNTFTNYTLIDNPATNGRPSAILFVTPDASPSLGYNNHAIGVWYAEGPGKWSTFNQDIGAMPVGTAFDVSVLD